MKAHNRRTRQLVRLFTVVVMLAAVSLPLLLRAQGEPALLWGNVTGGYGISSGGSYRVAGTSGEVDAGAVSGGGYRLSGGFWGIVDEPPPWIPPAGAAYKLFLPSTIDN